MTDGFLFIGGCHDGKVMSIPGEILHNVKIAKKETMGSTLGSFESDIYIPMKLKGDSEEFVVYALSGMRPNEVLTRLIINYKHDTKQ
jgi:hypothetical protein